MRRWRWGDSTFGGEGYFSPRFVVGFVYPLGHVGIAVGAAYALGAVAPSLRRVDFRLLALGAVLPDLVDKGAYGLMGVPLSKGPGHTLGLSVALLALAVVLALLRRRGAAGAAAVGAGALSHQLLDRPWMWAPVFLQPAPAAQEWIAWNPAASASGYLATWTLAGEVVGVVFFAWVAWRARLWRPRARRALAREGRLGHPE